MYFIVALPWRIKSSFFLFFVFIFAATEERYFELTSRFDGPLADLSIKQVALYDSNVTQSINNRWWILLEKLQNGECFCRRISSVPSRLPVHRSYPHFTQILFIILVPRVFFLFYRLFFSCLSFLFFLLDMSCSAVTS